MAHIVACRQALDERGCLLYCIFGSIHYASDLLWSSLHICPFKDTQTRPTRQWRVKNLTMVEALEIEKRRTAVKFYEADFQNYSAPLVHCSRNTPPVAHRQWKCPLVLSFPLLHPPKISAAAPTCSPLPRPVHIQLHSLSRLSRYHADSPALFVSVPVRPRVFCLRLQELPAASRFLSACGSVARRLLLINSDFILRSGFSPSSHLKHCWAGATPGVRSSVYGVPAQ